MFVALVLFEDADVIQAEELAKVLNFDVNQEQKQFKNSRINSNLINSD